MPTKEKPPFEVPPLRCLGLAVIFGVFVISWGGRLLGYPWEAMKGYKQLAYGSLIAIILIFLPFLAKKLRKRGTIERTQSEKELYK